MWFHWFLLFFLLFIFLFFFLFFYLFLFFLQSFFPFFCHPRSALFSMEQASFVPHFQPVQALIQICSFQPTNSTNSSTLKRTNIVQISSRETVFLFLALLFFLPSRSLRETMTAVEKKSRKMGKSNRKEKESKK